MHDNEDVYGSSGTKEDYIMEQAAFYKQIMEWFELEIQITCQIIDVPLCQDRLVNWYYIYL